MTQTQCESTLKYQIPGFTTEPNSIGAARRPVEAISRCELPPGEHRHLGHTPFGVPIGWGEVK